MSADHGHGGHDSHGHGGGGGFDTQISSNFSNTFISAASGVSGIFRGMIESIFGGGGGGHGHDDHGHH